MSVRLLVVAWLVLGSVGIAQESPLLRLLKSGKLPKERIEAVVEMACKNAGPDDLRFIFEQAIDPDAYPPKARLKALQSLQEAALTRQVKPTGDLSPLATLIADGKSRELQLAAMRLATQWKVAAAGDAFGKLALDPNAGEAVRNAALEGLAAVSGESAKPTLLALAKKGQPQEIRYRAIAALVALDLDAAAEQAALALVDAQPQDMPTALLDAFINRKGGGDKLAAALGKQKLSKDVAKLALRTMYAAGQNDPALSEVLSSAAGVAADPPLPTPDDIKRLSAEAVAKGDAERGEKIFRRADSTCLRCHSLVKAGGQVGPDLSALGVSSPVEYVVTSILDPSAAMKETYVTRNFMTSDGEVITGIVLERDEEKVKLKDAKGKITTLATSDIEREKEGKSLMPNGVTKFLTHDELLDLIRFVSELGKAGPFGPRATPTIQRWRVLKNVPSELAQIEVTNLENVRTFLTEAGEDAFVPAYAQVNGVLPLAELSPTPEKPTVLYLRGEIDVTAGGQVGFRYTTDAKVTAWVDGSLFEGQSEFTTELAEGRHKVTLRVVTQGKPGEGLMLEVFPPAGSTANFAVVGGE